MISKISKRFKVGFCAVLILAGVVSFSSAAKKNGNGKEDNTFEQIKLLVDVYQQILQNYVDEVDSQNLIYGAATGLVNTLDPFSQFMVPEAREEMQTVTEGHFGGLGIRIMMKDNWLTVITPLPETPAYRAGVLPEDRIIMIDEESTQGISLQDAVKKLRGAPKTQVKITLAREGAKEPIPVTLTRENIVIASVRSKMLTDDIGFAIGTPDFSQAERKS
jgi:carboxyl-terminal processing protease